MSSTPLSRPRWVKKGGSTHGNLSYQMPLKMSCGLAECLWCSECFFETSSNFVCNLAFGFGPESMMCRVNLTQMRISTKTFWEHLWDFDLETKLPRTSCRGFQDKHSYCSYPISFLMRLPGLLSCRNCRALPENKLDWFLSQRSTCNLQLKFFYLDGILGWLFGVKVHSRDRIQL